MSEALLEVKLLPDKCVRDIIHFSLIMGNYTVNNIVWDTYGDAFLFEDTDDVDKKFIHVNINNVRTKCIIKDLLWKLENKQEPTIYLGAGWQKEVSQNSMGITVILSCGQFSMSLIFHNYSEKDLLNLKNEMTGDLDELKRYYPVLITDIEKEMNEVVAILGGNNEEQIEERAYSLKGASLQEIECEINNIIKKGYSVKSQSICYNSEFYSALVIFTKRKKDNTKVKTVTMNMF